MVTGFIYLLNKPILEYNKRLYPIVSGYIKNESICVNVVEINKDILFEDVESNARWVDVEQAAGCKIPKTKVLTPWFEIEEQYIRDV